jgi:hypothetical protein
MTPEAGSASAGKTPTSLTPEMTAMLSLKYVFVLMIVVVFSVGIHFCSLTLVSL